VCAEISHHIAKGWDADMERDQLAVSGWLGDVPQDALVVHAGHVVGAEKLQVLALAAEASGDWWLAGRLWAVTAAVKARLEGIASQSIVLAKSADAVARFREGSAGPLPPAVLDDADEVELLQLQGMGVSLDMPAIMARVAAASREPPKKALCARTQPHTHRKPHAHRRAHNGCSRARSGGGELVGYDSKATATFICSQFNGVE
jgi:hypothetical protein